MEDPASRLLPEEKLLITLCRLDFSDELKSEVRDLMKQIKDWDYFVKKSNEHGIIALSWYNITRTGNSNNIPKEYYKKIYDAYLLNLARNTYLNNELINILELTKDKELRIVLLKGMALERTYYGNRGLRQMTDIDILVSQHSVLELQRILIKNGFKSNPYKSGLYKYLIPYLNYHVPRLTKEDCHIEIHCKLFDQIDNSLTELMLELSVPEKIDNNEAFIPSPQLFFLYLLSHLKHHETSGDSQLRLYSDLYILLASEFDEIVNDNLREFAEKAGIEHYLANLLYILNRFWRLEYPDWLNAFVKENYHTGIVTKFLSILKNPNENPEIKESSNFIVQIRYIPGFFRKLLYVTGFMIPSIRFMQKRYNLKSSAGVLVSYPARWFGILKYLVRRK